MNHPSVFLFLKWLLVLLAQIHLGLGVFAQNHKVLLSGDEDALKEARVSGNFEAADSISVLYGLQEVKNQLIAKGYLTSGIEDMRWSHDTVRANVYAGDKYEWAELKPGNVPEEFLSIAKYREKVFRNDAFNPKQLADLFTKLVSIAENKGYPFAAVKLDSVNIQNQSISGILNMEKNQFTVLDSLIIKGNIKTSRKYIENYVGFKKNEPFNQAHLNSIPYRLNEIPFAKVIKSYEIGVRPGKADVYLYLDQRKASSFDGIIGILPDNETGKILITGDVKLNLMNALKRGETINLRWQRLETNTQELNLDFAYPFIFNTPLGLSFDFDLYRQDTLYSQLNAEFGLQYFIKGGNYTKVYYRNTQANVISNNQLTVGDFIDSRINMFGVGLDFNKLDYKFNPRSGYFIKGDVAIGEKEILQNPEIDEAEYEDIELESDIYNFNLYAGTYLPFGKRSTLLFRANGGYFLNDNMFRNEMYRIGGLKTLRGFDEQSILASAYMIATIEYRFILEQNSNLFLFFDQAAYEDAGREDIIQDTPFGFGGGISFETNAGVFSLTYALGKQFDNPIEIRSGKIHFGFVSFF